MASLVGAILFFAPNHTSHFPLPFPTFIYHFHLPLPRLVPSGCYPMAGRVHSVRPVPFLCQIPILPEPLPDGTPLQCPGQQQLRHSAPASNTSATAPPAGNKPHPAEKSTPVWLAIWRTWAGFANSQHRDAAFATPDNICAHSSLLPHWAAAQTDANLSAHLHRLPTPPPYLRRMRLPPGRVLGCWVLDEAFARQWCR